MSPRTPILAGRRVLITRDPDRAAPLATALARLGAEMVVAPVTAVAPGDCAALDAAVRAIGSYAWCVVTSVNAVTALRDSAARLGVDLTGGPVRWAVVGPATRTALEGLGLGVDLVPTTHSAAGLVAALTTLVADQPGLAGRVLLPQSNLAAATLADGLRGAGFVPQVIVAYQTVPVPVPDDVRAAWLAGAIDAVVLASGSAAREVARQLGPRPDVAGIALGDPTATAARDAGLRVDAISDQTTAGALVAAIVAALTT